jgi:CRISPR-associated protein Csd1
MILQALKEYYDRKTEDGSIAKDGWLRVGIDFLLDLDTEGNIQNISDLREADGKKKVPHFFDVPNIGKQALKHTNSGKDANLLWDNAAFVFGLGDKGNQRLQSMIEVIDSWIGNTDDIGVLAVRNYLVKGLENRNHFNLALNHPEYGELMQKGNVKISFRIPKIEFNCVFN